MVPDFHHCPRCGREPHSPDFRRRDPFFISHCRACGENFCDECAGEGGRCPECGGEDIDECHDYVGGL